MFAKNFRAASSSPLLSFFPGFSKQLSLLKRKSDKTKPPEVQGIFSELVLLMKTMYCAIFIVVHQLREQLYTMVVLC